MSDEAAGGGNVEWEARVKGILKAELKRRGVTFAQFVGKLAAIGVHETKPNVRNKLARGNFTAAFFVKCIKDCGASTIRLSE